jgi:hypothetical protein
MAMFIARLARARRSLLAAGVFAAISGLSTAQGFHASAGNIMSVSSCEDDGSPGTLRAAIDAANDGDTIDLRDLACSTITLQNGLSTSVTNLTIVGAGSDALTIDGNDDSRVMQGGNLALEGLTLANGRVSGASDGGACILGDSVSLTDVVLVHCVNFSATNAVGGAVIANGDLTMRNTEISGSGAAGSGYAMGGAAFVAGSATLYDSTIRGNSVQAGGMAYGGGISANGGITLHRSTIESNTVQSSADAAYGGGMHSFGGVILVVEGSTVSGNTAHADQAWAYGGGLNAGTANTAGSVIVSNSSVTGNSASSMCGVCLVSGGGVHAFDSVDATSSTFSENEATCDVLASQCLAAGGGLAALGTSATSWIALHNSTVSGNNAFGGTAPGAFAAGGGIIAAPGLRVIARNSTIAFNHADTLGGGIAATSSTSLSSELVSTIVADNDSDSGADDIIAGPIGNDLVLAGSNNIVTAAGNNVTLPDDTSTEEPLLLPLTTDNGGPTATHALGTGSPAIDAGANPDGALCDQRGSPHLRIRDGRADIGAYESFSLLADGFEPPPQCM